MHNYSIYNTNEVFDKSDINRKTNKAMEEEWREEDRKEARKEEKILIF